MTSDDTPQPVLASSFTRAGHGVTLTASNPDNARAAATQTCARAADSNQQAVGAAEAVVLAVQYPTLDAVLAEAGDAIDGKVLIDATNRVDPAASWTAPRPPSRSRVVVAGGLLATAREVAGKLLGNRTTGQPVTVPRWRERRADLR